ncbi:MAG: hypothetical protein L0G99_09185 [Propionibacteriales bacterium]|nr:hypothetical protein [Propionibacteriales bacterium]
MAWFKVDDKFHSHPKVIGLPLRTIGLWTKAGAWSSDQLTDGFVPRAMLTILGGNAGDARTLVAAGLWSTTDDGWQFHDWADQNPSRTEVLAHRERDRDRKADWRAKKAELRAIKGGAHG